MLRESLDTEFESADEAEAFQSEIVRQIIGDEKTIVTKINGIDWYRTQLDAAEAAISEKEKQLYKVKTAIRNRRDRMKKCLVEVMRKIFSDTGSKQIKNDCTKICLQKHGEKEPVEIDNADLVPFSLHTYTVTISGLSMSEAQSVKENYEGTQCRVKTESHPDKELIREYLSLHGRNEWAHIGEQHDIVVIKAGV
jgi:hypothetical protein